MDVLIERLLSLYVWLSVPLVAMDSAVLCEHHGTHWTLSETQARVELA